MKRRTAFELIFPDFWRNRIHVIDKDDMTT